jgi:hypothetical protein
MDRVEALLLAALVATVTDIATLIVRSPLSGEYG